MYSGNKILMNTIRAMKTEITNLVKAKGSDGEVSQQEAFVLLQSMIKKRADSALIYKEHRREDLRKIEMEEIEIIKKYLPEQMSDIELRSNLVELVGVTGVQSMKQLGVLLKATIARLDGRSDRKRISDMAKLVLAAYEKQKRK